MANAFNPNANQWALDTVDADGSDFGDHGDGSTAIKVKRVRWVGPSTQGHTVVLHDQDGVVLFAAEADADLNDVEALIEGWWKDGMVLPTIASGVLYVDLY